MKEPVGLDQYASSLFKDGHKGRSNSLTRWAPVTAGAGGDKASLSCAPIGGV